jgi:hypothetical protein
MVTPLRIRDERPCSRSPALARLRRQRRLRELPLAARREETIDPDAIEPRAKGAERAAKQLDLSMP